MMLLRSSWTLKLVFDFLSLSSSHLLGGIHHHNFGLHVFGLGGSNNRACSTTKITHKTSTTEVVPQQDLSACSHPHRRNRTRGLQPKTWLILGRVAGLVQPGWGRAATRGRWAALAVGRSTQCPGGWPRRPSRTGSRGLSPEWVRPAKF